MISVLGGSPLGEDEQYPLPRAQRSQDTPALVLRLVLPSAATSDFHSAAALERNAQLQKEASSHYPRGLFDEL